MSYRLTGRCIGDPDLKVMISDRYDWVCSPIHFHLFWFQADCWFFKRKLYNFLLSRRNGMCRLRYLTGLLPKSPYLVIKVTCMDMMLLAPAFIRKAAGTAFLDQIQPFFIGASGISFRHKIQLLFFIWSGISTGTRRTEVKWS